MCQIQLAHPGRAFGWPVVLAMLLAIASRGADAQSASSPRPLILIVHGRAQQSRDSAQVRREAFEALQSTARRLTGDSLIGESDVRLVWYADLMGRARPVVAAACDDLSLIAGARRQAPLNAVTVIAGLAGMLLDASNADTTLADSPDLRGISGDMRFLADGDTRCASELRLARALDDARRAHRPVILISHSLGGLVSWDLLAHAAPRDSASNIARWVTIGSPVGSPEIRTLVFGDETASLSLPRGVGSWVNVLGDSDPLAIAISDSTRSLGGVSDVRTLGAHGDAHQMASYLGDVATARAVFGAWCTASPVKGQRAACARLQTSASTATSPPLR